MKKKLLLFTFTILLLLGLFIVKLSLDSERIPVLTYHHISENKDERSPITIAPEKFEEDMLYLKALGYNTINFKDLILHREGKNSLPENPIIVTFDDGYRSNYTYAYPILKKLKMKAVISIIGNLIDVSSNTDYDFMLTWDQLKEMVDSNVIEVQSHSYNLHTWGDKINTPRGASKIANENNKEYEARFRKDTQTLLDQVHTHLGTNLTMYTYPYGIYTDESQKILKDMGFKGSLLGKTGINSTSNGLSSLKRINMVGGTSSPTLMRKILLLQVRPKKIPFSNLDSSSERLEKLREQFKTQ
ncbi:polysaccharide deacetylase family protein [Lutibacter sp. B2]|nr:polysaccharide deacetylase family protein [Lutibacter sp. B2]